SRLFAIGAVLSLLWNTTALACDPPTTKMEVVGRSADGKSLLLRSEDTEAGWIELKILALKDGTFLRTIPIVKAEDPKEKRPELRKTRWSAADEVTRSAAAHEILKALGSWGHSHQRTATPEDS